ncbi:MAG: HD domain-containing protein [Desulfofustis sp.]|nr:HD domain-containing protein [Desulfofustis sp.]
MTMLEHATDTGSVSEKPSYGDLVRRIEQLERETSALRKTKEQYVRTSSILKATLESTADCIVVVDFNGRIINYNSRFQALCDLSKERMRSLDDNQILMHFMNLVSGPEEFIRKIGQIYKSPGDEVHDHVEFKDGRIFKRVSLPQIINDRIVGRVWNFSDITEIKRSEEELQETLKTLRRALGGTIQAIALTVEKKDPYTAGHQQRVSDLARAIATEMRLPRKTVDGIRLAASIHDIGKNSVPADILSKPGKLTDHEFGIIKTHPEVGFEILRGIKFPWPIAKTILQHHERLDGSGYPNGLKGSDILIEARIIAVADVVEAISSHRPYRPALGMNVAMHEISKGRGIIYDAEAVDTCIRLVTQKKYQFRFSNWNYTG